MFDSKDLVAARMSFQFLAGGSTEGLFMVEPILWAFELEVTRIPGWLNPRASQSQSQTEWRAPVPPAGRFNQKWRRDRVCVSLYALLHVGLETWEWENPESAW